jgi:hypothetical protein
MSLASYLARKLADLGDEAAQSIRQTFARRADNAANRQAVDEAVAAARRQAPSLAARPQPQAAPSLAARPEPRQQRARQPRARAAEQPVVLNIGLGRGNELNPDPTPIDPEQAIEAVNALGVPVTRITRAPADGVFDEEAVIFELGRRPSDKKLFDLSQSLDQEAVSIWDGQRGGTYGPLAEKWPFDAQYLRLPDGGVLADRLAARNQETLAASGIGAPAILSARSGSAPAVARDILSEAAEPSRGSPSYAEWRRANPDRGVLFDMSNLSAVPDVPQSQMPRYNPARGTSARLSDALSSEEVARGINDTVERGIEAGGLEWYNTEPMRQRLAAIAPDSASSQYARLMDTVAATSPRARVPDNIRTAAYYNYLLAQGAPLPDKPARGYGSVAQNLHRDNVRNIERMGGWDVFRNPKPASFSTNLQGNQRNVTIDTHNFRLPGILSRDPRFLETSVSQGAGVEPIRPRRLYESGEMSLDDLAARPAMWASKPNPNEYGAYEAWQQEQARNLGVSPAQYQASMWLGGGEETGLGSAAEPFLETFESRIRYTADRLNIDPEVLLEMVLRGDVPLLRDGGRVDQSLAVRR